MTHAKMYALAGRYQFDAEMKDHCIRRFTAEADAHWKDDSFADACLFVFTSTPDSDRGLRDAVISIAYSNIAVLMKQKAFRTQLHNIAGLAEGVLDEVLLLVKPDRPTFYCGNQNCMKNRSVACSSCKTYNLSLPRKV